MNYTVFFIFILLTVMIFTLIENRKLRRLNLGLYTKHSVTIGRGSFYGEKADESTDVSYFIIRWKEEDFTQIAEQKAFLEKALRAAGYGKETFRESDFRTLVRDRGFEAVTITPVR